MTFSNNATVHWDLSDPVAFSREEMLNRISNIALEGGFTNMVQAFEFAYTEVFNVEGDR